METVCASHDPPSWFPNCIIKKQTEPNEKPPHCDDQAVTPRCMQFISLLCVKLMNMKLMFQSPLLPRDRLWSWVSHTPNNEAPADSQRLGEVPSRRRQLIDDYVQYTVWAKSFILMGWLLAGKTCGPSGGLWGTVWHQRVSEVRSLWWSNLLAGAMRGTKTSLISWVLDSGCVPCCGEVLVRWTKENSPKGRQRWYYHILIFVSISPHCSSNWIHSYNVDTWCFIICAASDPHTHLHIPDHQLRSVWNKLLWSWVTPTAILLLLLLFVRKVLFWNVLQASFEKTKHKKQ